MNYSTPSPKPAASLATCPFSGYPKKHCGSACTHRVIERQKRERKGLR